MFRLMHLYYQVFKFKADDVCFVCNVFSSFIAFLHHFKISIVFFFLSRSFCPLLSFPLLILLHPAHFNVCTFI